LKRLLASIGAILEDHDGGHEPSNSGAIGGCTIIASSGSFEMVAKLGLVLQCAKCEAGLCEWFPDR